MYDPAKHKSYFIISEEELQSIINKYYGTGEVKIKENGQIKEILSVKDNIGVCVDIDGNFIEETNRMTIHYSKKRTHIVPTKRRK